MTLKSIGYQTEALPSFVDQMFRAIMKRRILLFDRGYVNYL